MLGNNIRKLRLLNDMTLKDLSKVSGVGLSTISEIESGKITNPRTNTLNKIAIALKVKPNYLLGLHKEFNSSLHSLEDEQALKLVKDILKLNDKDRELAITMVNQMLLNSKKEANK